MTISTRERVQAPVWLTGPAEGCLRLYIGTSNIGYEVAKTRGFFGLRDHHALANEIEREFGLPEDAIWNHFWFDYVRGSRAKDRMVYTTDDYDNACYYAHALNESTVDALKTAHRILNDALMRELDALPVDEQRGAWKTHEQAFIESWRQTHAEIRPVIVALDVPAASLHVPDHVADRFSSEEWWEAVTDGGQCFAHEVPFPERVPVDWVVAAVEDL